MYINTKIYIIFKIFQNMNTKSHRERGQGAVYNTNPQSFIITFSYSLAQEL